jgi:iron complex outermembrane receptor protein
MVVQRVGTGLCFAAAVSAGVYAAGAAASAAEPASRGSAIEEVVVTAQKRAQSLQDVPVSVTALGAETLNAHGIQQASDIADLTPGLYFESIGLRSPFIFVRGTGSGQFDVGSDSSVSVFIDEIYQSRFTALQFDLLDVERVEVLKGPQGALFGRNTSGGAISVVTAKPSWTPMAEALLEYGNQDHVFARGAVSGPLSDAVAARLSVAHRKRDGWVENELSGTEHLDTDSLGARGQLQVDWGSGDVLLSASVGRERSGAATFQNVTPVVPFLSPASPLFGQVPSSDDVRHQRYDTDGYQDRDSLLLSATLNADLGAATLTSITAYGKAEFEELHDLDGTEAAVLNRFADEESDSFSQELRLASSEDRSFDWLVGVYYFEDDAERDERWTLGTDMLFTLPLGQIVDAFDSMRVDTRSWAMFGQLGADLSERWRVALGARYSEDDKDADRLTDRTVPTPILFEGYTARAGDTWNSFDPTVSVQFRPSDRVMTYLSYAEGFKSGGFQPAIPANAEFAEATFDPEEVASYEVGLKSTLWNDRLRLNAAAFHVEYEDLQFIAATGTASSGAPLVVIANAAESTTNGLEVEAEALLGEHLSLSAGYSWLDAEFDRYIDGSGNDQSGNQVIRTPEHQGHLTADLIYPLRRGQVSAMVSVRAQSRVYFNPENTRALSQEGYEQLTARLGYESADGRWALDLWGRNLTDEEVCGNVLPLLGSAAGLCSIDSLRSYGLRFAYRWE